MTVPRGERGFTLVELLLTMTLLLVVTGATLDTLGVLTKNAHRSEQAVAEVERARGALERVTRRLRNVSGYPTASAPSGGGIVRAGAFDVVFRSVARDVQPTAANPHGVETVRFCADHSRAVLVEQRWPDVVTPSASCPDPARPATEFVGGLVNGTGRPLFTYDTATPRDIASVAVNLILDADPEHPPAETALSSGVYLRNQNRRPTAAFTAVSGPGRHVQLNGSASVDPEGQMLTFVWKDGDVELPQAGPVIDYIAPATGLRTITLDVVDAGGLGASARQTVEVRP